MSADRRVAVIGSGFAGLAAAAVLAERGCTVDVFEKNAELGGRARRFEAAGLRFDMGPSWYWMPEVFEAFFGLFGKKVADYYQLKRLQPSFSVYYGPGERLDVPDGREDLRALFERLEPGSGKRLDIFLAEAAYKYRVGMERMVHQPGRSWRELADWGFVRGMARMHVFGSFHRYVRRYFRDPRLIRLLEFPVLFLGGMPANTPALYSLMNHAELELGTWYPMGGMGRIIDGMVALCDELGVRFHRSCGVERVEVRHGRAVGVEAGGAAYGADAVVAAADYHHVEQTLLEPRYRRYDEAYWQKRVLAPSSLLYYLGVEGRVEGLRHHTLFFDEDLDRHAHQLYVEPDWPDRPLFYVCCPSKTDPEVAPQGCENLFVLVPVAPGLAQGEGVADRYLEVVFERLERLTGQALKGRVFYRRDYGIDDFVGDYNAYRGNAYGLANTLMQSAIFKPKMCSPKVDNLFFAGQLTVPGPGVPPSLISGRVAAGQVLRRLEG